jgi:catechol 2,3-dioxygenase-like lactoylglutathione lyase family enzyme
MDTADGERLGRFWAAVAGLEFRADEGAGDLVGPTEGHGVAVCTVPEEKSVKHRVHLDVYAASVEDLVTLGARVVLPAEESGFRWTVMTDPEGGEFCAFPKPRQEMPAYTVHGLVVDCADPEAAARWWGEVLGGELGGDADKGWWWLTEVPGLPITSMDFVPVPEPKTVKNRIHWDVYGTVAALEERGARLLRARDADPSTGSGHRISWDVMTDPEGNEFCVFAG